MDISDLVKNVRSGVTKPNPLEEMMRMFGDQPITWSFDSGLPDPSTFPIDDLSRLATEVLRADAANALHYGSGMGSIMMGYEGLREALVEREKAQEGKELTPDGVMLTLGSVQALSLACSSFLERGDVFAVDAPTWPIVLMHGQRVGAEPLAVPLDREGLQVDVLETHLARLRREGRRLNMLYTINTFNTPTGWSTSLPRRRKLIELVEEYEFLVLEDNTYGELRYDGETLPTLLALDTTGLVMRADSFSKTLAPGLRLGWISGHPEVVRAVSGARGDLGVSQWLGRLMARYLEEGLYEPHLARVNELYRRKRDLAAAALRDACGQWVSFEIPEGGFFLWVQLSEEVDGAEVMTKAVANGVVCRPGERFFGESEAAAHQQWFRMAFSMVPESELERGIAALGKAIADSVR